MQIVTKPNETRVDEIVLLAERERHLRLGRMIVSGSLIKKPSRPTLAHSTIS